MRTTIGIDARMLEELVEATGARSGSAALNEATAADRRRERFLDSLG